MSKKIEYFNPDNNIHYTSGYSYNQNINNQENNNNFQSINRSFDETKDNIKRSLDESKNQIPHYNDIVNNYQEQSLQIVRYIRRLS